MGSLLCASTLYERARKGNKRPIGTTVEHQLSAKLHCYYGVPVEYLNRAMYRPVYPYAASKVYDLREYKEKTFWGPFVDDGSQYVDWEKVEAIMLVLSHNLQIFSDRTNGTFEPIWIDPFAGATPDSYIAPPLTASESLLSDPDFEDPYNVTGNWMRVSSSTPVVFSKVLMNSTFSGDHVLR